MLKQIGFLVTAAVIGALLLDVGEDMAIPGVYGVVSSAYAVVGGPGTLASVGGVARRSTRSAVRRCAYGVTC
jgi:hypothetical protein